MSVSSVHLIIGQNFRIQFYVIQNDRDYNRGGAEGALAPPEFGGSERRTERETDNLLLLAPPESKS